MEGRGPARRARRGAAAAGGVRRRLRAAASTTSTTCPTAASSASCPTVPACRGGSRSTRDGPRPVAVPQEPAGAARRDRPRAVQRRDLPRLHARLPVLPGRDDHPTGARALASRASATWSRTAWTRPASRRSGCCRCPAPTTPRSARSPSGSADRYEGTNTSLSLPSTRVDAFNITLANEFSRNGRRSGLTFAPEGGSERLRKVINKMVTEDDLIRTVAAAYSHGWRQVKLYFMCGLPTETDEDVMQIGELAKRVIQTGREVVRPPRHPVHRVDRRLRAQAAHAVPVGGAARPRDDRRAAAQAARRRSAPTGSTARRSASATTTASPGSSRDCCPAATAGSAGSSRRCGATAAASTAGASTSRTTAGPAMTERGAGRRAGRPRLVHHPRARVRRGAALGPPRRRARPRLALGGLAGRPRPRRRPRGRGLPLDARASTAASARRWAPRSRSAPPARPCCRSASSDGSPRCGFPGEPGKRSPGRVFREPGRTMTPVATGVTTAGRRFRGSPGKPRAEQADGLR